MVKYSKFTPDSNKDVDGKDVVIIDDMVDTAGTLTKAADLMINKGATSVRACLLYTSDAADE